VQKLQLLRVENKWRLAARLKSSDGTPRLSARGAGIGQRLVGGSVEDHVRHVNEAATVRQPLTFGSLAIRLKAAPASARTSRGWPR